MPFAPLAEAAEARRIAQGRRADALARLASGRLDLRGLARLAEEHRAVGRLRLTTVLDALPGWGPRRAERVLRRLGWAEERRLQWLVGTAGSSRLSRLLEEVYPSPPPVAPRGLPWFDGKTG
ncbi:MAG: integration host factor [Actinomycetota bacterium]|nr:integration host factor [Actinomycetota bacterium]